MDRALTLSSPATSEFVITDGRRVAVVVGARRGLLEVGDVPSSRGSGRSGRTVQLRTVPGAGGFSEPLAWLDSRHVAVFRALDLRFHRAYRLDSVDVRSGDARTLVRADRGDHQVPATAVDLARDLLNAAPTHASPPPRPWDLRGVAIGVLIGTVCLALTIWGIRGRRA